MPFVVLWRSSCTSRTICGMFPLSASFFQPVSVAWVAFRRTWAESLQSAGGGASPVVAAAPAPLCRPPAPSAITTEARINRTFEPGMRRAMRRPNESSALTAEFTAPSDSDLIRAKPSGRHDVATVPVLES